VEDNAMQVIPTALLALIVTPQGDKQMPDHKLMQGLWQAVSVEFDGQKSVAPDLLARTTITFDSDKWVSEDVVGMKVKGVFRLNQEASPKEIDFIIHNPHEQPIKLRGIYLLRGRTLTICFTHKGARPKEFVSKKGSNLMLVVYRSVQQ
jgi:uncharacterized protein (TIGR03067 family)